MRDSWFTELIGSKNVPFSYFNTIRNSQLGQLYLPIQSNRAKMIRAGEDPGPSIFDFSTLSQITSTYNLINQILEFYNDKNSDEIDFSKLKDHVIIEKIESTLTSLNVSNYEWEDKILDEIRIDEIYFSCIQTFVEAILIQIGTKIEITDKIKIFDELKTNQPQLYQTLSLFLNITHYNIENNHTWKTEDNQKYKIFLENEADKMRVDEFQLKALSLILFFQEIVRLVKSNKMHFENTGPLLALEMLIKLPYPEKSFIPIIRDHLNVIKTGTGYNAVFELLFLFFQLYSNGMNPSNPRIYGRMYKKSLSKFKETTRDFWKNINDNEVIITVVWSAFSSAIAQLNHKMKKMTTPSEIEKQCYSIITNLDKIFWSYGREFLESNKLNSQIYFWSYIIYITSKQLRSAKDSLDSFQRLDNLFQKVNIFEINDNNKLDLSMMDKYSLLQKIISFGIEARTEQIFDKIKKYNSILVDLLNKIKTEKIGINLNLDREFEAIDEINKYLNNPNIPE